jgi:hypothetical protein
LSGLAATPERPRRQRPHVGLVQHDVERVEVFGESPNFDVSALADDHGMVAVADERLHRSMRHVHERARGVHDFETERARADQGALRRAVRGDHDADSAGSFAVAIPLARRPARTASLWTRSPRTVSGAVSLRRTARSMASRTPKHIPR